MICELSSFSHSEQSKEQVCYSWQRLWGAPCLVPGSGWGHDMLGRSYAQWRPDSWCARPQLSSGSEYWTQQPLSHLSVNVGSNVQSPPQLSFVMEQGTKYKVTLIQRWIAEGLLSNLIRTGWNLSFLVDKYWWEYKAKRRL